MHNHKVLWDLIFKKPINRSQHVKKGKRQGRRNSIRNSLLLKSSKIISQTFGNIANVLGVGGEEASEADALTPPQLSLHKRKLTSMSRGLGGIENYALKEGKLFSVGDIVLVINQGCTCTVSHVPSHVSSPASKLFGASTGRVKVLTANEETKSYEAHELWNLTEDQQSDPVSARSPNWIYDDLSITITIVCV
jgi:hypothetical protein